MYHVILSLIFSIFRNIMIMRGGFASVCLPMEIPAGASHPGSFDLNEEHLTYMNFQLLQRSVHAYNALTFVEIENAGPGTVTPGFPLQGPIDFVYDGWPQQEFPSVSRRWQIRHALMKYKNQCHSY